VTHGSLRCEIPRLEPDDDFVDRLAELAAASRPARGGIVVPVAFGGPTARAVAIAAAVAAVTAGAAAAATQLSHARQDEPSPPTSSVGIHRPHDATGRRPTTDTHHARHQESDAAEPADDRTGSDPGATRQSPPADVAVAPMPQGPGDTTSGSNDPSTAPSDHHGDHHGDGQGDQGDQQGDQGDQQGDQQGDHSGSDTSGDSGGDSGPGTSDGGSQDGGGPAGSEDGSGAGSGSDPSSVPNGSSD